MSLGYQNSISANIPFKAEAALSAPLSKPIETVQKTIENSVDTIVKTVDKDKDTQKTRNAIAVGSSVLVLSGLVALLNPKISPKVVEKLKSISKKAKTNADKNSTDTFLGKLYKGCQTVSDGTINSIRFINNFNSFKDLGFKWFCTEKKDFLNIKNKSTRNILKKMDGGVRKILAKPYNTITEWFDKIGKHTVLSKYSGAAKKMDSFENLLNQYKTRLSEPQKIELENKLTEAAKMREYFSESAIRERFGVQEATMSELEGDFWSKYQKYTSGFRNKWQKKSEHIGQNLSFWAEDILYPKKVKIENAGQEAVAKLVGDGADNKGVYDEALSIISPHLSADEAKALEKALGKTSKSLRKANYSECTSYFDKKRDLILGSAPTDVVTAIAGLGLSGVALSTANNKDERISRMLTGVFPIIGGLATSIILTAMLVSGPVGMVAGSAIGVILNRIGSFTNKHILGKKEVDINV